jgi:cytoskeletal protein RodZ
MDMDLMDMEEFDDFDEDAAEEEGEGQNRLFIIAVAVMSGVLLIGVIAFCAWVLFVGGFIGGGETTDVTPTADAAALAALTATAEVEETTTAEAAEPTETSTPTEAPPTNTPRPTETPTTAANGSPTPEVSPVVTQTEESTAVGEVTPTLGPRTSPTAPGGTPPPDTVSDTGLGAFTAAIVAIGLLLLLVTARRLRTTR